MTSGSRQIFWLGIDWIRAMLAGSDEFRRACSKMDPLSHAGTDGVLNRVLIAFTGNVQNYRDKKGTGIR